MKLFALFLILCMASAAGLTWTSLSLYFNYHKLNVGENALG